MEGGPSAVPLAEPEYSVRRVDAARARDTDVSGGEARAQGRRMKKATLALACGETFDGFACGAGGEAQVAGFIARRVSREPSNWRADESLPAWLARHGVVGIEGVDTRRLVRVLRSSGAQQGIIDSSGASAAALVERARRLPGMEGQDLASKVSCKKPYEWKEGVAGREPQAPRHDVVVVDYWVKRGILRQLVDSGCRVRVVPSRTPAAEILAQKPHGVVLSN